MWKIVPAATVPPAADKGLVPSVPALIMYNPLAVIESIFPVKLKELPPQPNEPTVSIAPAVGSTRLACLGVLPECQSSRQLVQVPELDMVRLA